MTTLDVYSVNVPVSQISPAFPMGEVEAERNEFLIWMKNVGRKFESQADAWDVYVGEIWQAEDAIKKIEDMTNEEYAIEYSFFRALNMGCGRVFVHVK